MFTPPPPPPRIISTSFWIPNWIDLSFNLYSNLDLNRYLWLATIGHRRGGLFLKMLGYFEVILNIFKFYRV